MKWITYITLLLLCLSANAETFEERVQLAKDAEKTKIYKQYESVMFKAIGNHMANTMRTCFATIKNPSDSKFIVVANIQSAGNPSNVEVSPSTNISLCFAEGFKTAAFPEPPNYPGSSGLPIYIEMTITP